MEAHNISSKLICWDEIDGLNNHHKRVSELANLIARKMGLEEKEINDITFAALYHDLGKLLIPQKIINKPGELTEEEFKIIKRHPVYSYSILKNNGVEENICLMVKHHHERFNGTGYPVGLSGFNITLGARIIQICDVFDALTNDRVYKSKFNYTQALNIMNEEIFNYDPQIFFLFKKLVIEKIVR